MCAFERVNYQIKIFKKYITQYASVPGFSAHAASDILLHMRQQTVGVSPVPLRPSDSFMDRKKLDAALVEHRLHRLSLNQQAASHNCLHCTICEKVMALDDFEGSVSLHVDACIKCRLYRKSRTNAVR